MIGTFFPVMFAKNKFFVRCIEFGMMWNPSFGLVYCFTKTIFRYQFYTHDEGSIDVWGYNCGYLVQLVGFVLSIVIYPILTFMIEYNYCRRGIRSLKDDIQYEKSLAKDEDVAAEE